MSDEPTDAEPDEDVTAEDMARELRASLPSIYVDTWVTLTWRGHIRIVFGERLYQNDQYRAAFAMELDDAEKFARHLLRAIEKRRERDLESMKKGQDSESGA